MPDDDAPEDAARRAGRVLGAQVAAGLADLGQQTIARLVAEEKESRRTAPMSFALRADLKERLARFRDEGGTINVSGIANEAIERELDRLESGNAVRQRLLVELTERRGPSWTQGYQAGRQWGEAWASWLEITEYATRFGDTDVAVVAVGNRGFEEPEFAGTFRAPVRDYGEAPTFQRGEELGWETRPWECEAFWRGWLRAVRRIYDDNKADLPSVIDQLPPVQIPLPARGVDPHDIPF
jgi:hypothetical protein